MADLAGRKKTVMAVVAGFVLAIGAVTAAVLTGVIPRSAPVTTPEASAPPATASVEPATKLHKRSAVKSPSAPREVASTAVPPPPPCTNCGVVESVESFTEKGKASGGGAITGGLLGGILGHQVGKGRGKDLATVAGAVGGAIAGNEIEKNVNKATRYHVGVRMSDGTLAQLTLDAAPSLAVGDHVRIVNGELVRD